MKLINITKSLILEASARDVLVNKLKLTDKAADFFVDKCGKLSILIVNKIITSNLKYILKVETAPTKDELHKSISLVNLSYRTYNEDLTSIMDWIRVALNGDLGTHKNDDYQTLFNESKKWHDELEVGDGIYNYEENEDNIILDFRNENGMGFYWIDLLTSQCTYENKRMGHCASTGGDTLYSLRETRRINEKFTINESHLTAAIEEYYNGFKIIQLKGKKNSKPAEKYHKYIVELIINPTVNIIGFGSEYDSASDFKLSDLNDDLFNVVLKNNQKLIGTIGLYYAHKKGLIDEAPQVVFDIFIKPDEMYEYIDSGNYDNRKTNFVENFLENGVDYFDIDIDWQDFTYYSSNDLENKIEEYLINNFQDKINELNNENEDDEYFEDLKISDKIKELDADDLITVIRDSMSRAYEVSYSESIMRSIESALTDYGGVLRINDQGAKIKVNLLNFQNDIDSSEILSNPEDVKGILYKLVHEEEKIEKPTLYIKDDYYIDDDDFESNFYELCSEYNIPINE
jgi:hypothetical protein